MIIKFKFLKKQLNGVAYDFNNCTEFNTLYGKIAQQGETFLC